MQHEKLVRDRRTCGDPVLEIEILTGIEGVNGPYKAGELVTRRPLRLDGDF